MDKYEPIGLVARRDKYQDTSRVHCAEVAGPEASFCLDLVERWGMVAGQPDGEDSSGRSRLRLATPDELAERAMATTVAVYRRIREAGWMVAVQLPEPELAEVRAERG